MNRKDEYINLLKELDQTPVELEYTLTRAKAKAKSTKKKGFFTISLSSIAAFLIVFIIAVNTSIAFVQASARIPVLKDFAQLLTFSPSLSAAIEIYPIHIRLNFTDDKSNTAWLQSLDFYIENERGERYEAISNGISATGSPDSPMLASHRLESSFFSKSKSLALYIKGITWLDKDMEKVKLDLKNEVIEALPQDVALETVERVENSWLLTFSAKELDEGVRRQLWAMKYYDLQDNEYSINSYSSVDRGYFDEETQEYIEIPGSYQHEFALVDYPYDTVYLCPSYSRIVDLQIPIEIKIK